MARRPPDTASRHRIAFRDRGALHAAAARLLNDPLVESCSFDIEGLVVEVALSACAVEREQLAADWRRKVARAAGGARAR
jgi:hypothetical protein